MGGASYVGMGGTSLGCLHAFHEDEDGMARYKFGMMSQCSGISILMVNLIIFLAYLIFSPPIYQPTTKLVCELIKQVYFTKLIA
jgi:hypothetical protein